MKHPMQWDRHHLQVWTENITQRLDTGGVMTAELHHCGQRQEWRFEIDRQMEVMTEERTYYVRCHDCSQNAEFRNEATAAMWSCDHLVLHRGHSIQMDSLALVHTIDNVVEREHDTVVADLRLRGVGESSVVGCGSEWRLVDDDGHLYAYFFQHPEDPKLWMATPVRLGKIQPVVKGSREKIMNDLADWSKERC
jgi:hypothetical protein